MKHKNLCPRNRSIALEYLAGGTTFKKIAQKHGISTDRARQIFLEQLKLEKKWKHLKILKHHSLKVVGVLIDPDGIDGSELQEWTPQQQFEEFKINHG